MSILCRFIPYYTRYKMQKTGQNQSIFYRKRLGSASPVLRRKMSVADGWIREFSSSGENQSNFFFTSYKTGMSGWAFFDICQIYTLSNPP